MEKLVKPAFYTRDYDPSQCVAIRDRWQSFLYLKAGAKPVDIYVSTNDDLVMVFDKDETRPLYKLYREYKLN